ncbi:MAG: tRNA pseudouridine(13) synthase TruD, partial [Thiovulaceae bacterium]|nr:tRNA pseudouridine(13) synthase TruD [Sulfurimonadaceae bacterium]
MKRIYLHKRTEIPFFFRQSTDDFVVTERFSSFNEKGNYLIIEVQKQNLTTLELIKILEDFTQCFSIGYAGLKDKKATTTQYLSLPLKFSKKLKEFKHPQIKILNTFRHDQKISMGDLEGNHFFIRLKQVNEAANVQLQERLNMIQKEGMPNYFGYQRFGNDADNFDKSKEVAHGELHVKDKKMHKLLSNIYQSYLYNQWLVSRITFSEDIAKLEEAQLLEKYHLKSDLIPMLKNQPFVFKVLPGDILLDKSTKKWINVTDLQEVRKGLKQQKLVPTGLLAGKKAWRAQADAAMFEEPCDDLLVDAKGERRPAWVYPKEIKQHYNGKEQFFELSFFLPKGAYATVLLEDLANRNLK